MRKLINKKYVVVFLIFVFAFFLRLWNLNQMGRVWDEGAQFEDGYNFVRLYLKGDFNNPYLYNHPYHPPLTKLLYGAAAYLDVQKSGPMVNGFLPGEPTFNYDITNVRLVSVLFSSMTVALVVLIGWELSPLIGMLAGIILATLPIFLGLSQVASIESVLIFFFTATVFAFFKFLLRGSWTWTIFAGILLGLAMATKFTNAMLYPLLLIFYFTFIFIQKKEKRVYDVKKMFVIFLLSFFVFFAIWPMPWFHLKYVLDLNAELRISETRYTVPEVFYGKLIHVPKVYYFVMFAITTTPLIIITFFMGLKAISDLVSKKISINLTKRLNCKLPKIIGLIKKENTFLLISLVIWFSFPFLQSFYNFIQQGVRYIIQIYAPLSIISAIGIAWIMSLFRKLWQKIVIFCVVLFFLLVPLVRISPYYLDYYNILVGGTKNVYEKKLFMLGWWGQDLRDSGIYIRDHAKKGSSVGLAVAPVENVPPLPGLKAEKYNPNKKYDYVMVSNFNIIREGFNPDPVINNYKLIYSTVAEGARLVDVYQKK